MSLNRCWASGCQAHQRLYARLSKRLRGNGMGVKWEGTIIELIELIELKDSDPPNQHSWFRATCGCPPKETGRAPPWRRAEPGVWTGGCRAAARRFPEQLL